MFFVFVFQIQLLFGKGLFVISTENNRRKGINPERSSQTRGWGQSTTIYHKRRNYKLIFMFEKNIRKWGPKSHATNMYLYYSVKDTETKYLSQQKNSSVIVTIENGKDISYQIL